METNENIIGVGREAEVLAESDTVCVKWFYPGHSRHDALREAEKLAFVSEHGVQAPRFYGVVEKEGRIGLRMERVHGLSMLRELFSGPRPGVDYGELLGQTQRAFHAVSGVGLESRVDSMNWCIRHAEVLTPAEQEELCCRLARMEPGDRLLHGDYHMDNVLMTDRGPCVIDWTNAGYGNPLMDAARILFDCRVPVYPVDADDTMRAIIDGARASLLVSYLRGYGTTEAELSPWVPLVAAGRLLFAPEEERRGSLPVVKAYLDSMA